MQPETGALQGIWNFVSTFDAKKDPATRSTDRDCNSLNALVALLDTARADNRVLLRVASSTFMKTRLAKTFALTILREMVRGGSGSGGTCAHCPTARPLPRVRCCRSRPRRRRSGTSRASSTAARRSRWLRQRRRRRAQASRPRGPPSTSPPRLRPRQRGRRLRPRGPTPRSARCLPRGPRPARRRAPKRTSSQNACVRRDGARVGGRGEPRPPTLYPLAGRSHLVASPSTLEVQGLRRSHWRLICLQDAASGTRSPSGAWW